MPASAPIFPARFGVGVAGFNAPPGPEVAGFDPPTGWPRSRASIASPWFAWSLEQRERGLSAKRIHQDLLVELSAAAEVSYDSVRRLLKKHGAAPPVSFRRMESPTGFEAQVDFGSSKTSAGTMARPCSPRSRERHGTRARSSGESITCRRTPSRGGRSPASTLRTSISRSGRVAQPIPGFTGPQRSRCWPTSTKRNGQPSYHARTPPLHPSPTPALRAHGLTRRCFGVRYRPNCLGFRGRRHVAVVRPQPCLVQPPQGCRALLGQLARFDEFQIDRSLEAGMASESLSPQGEHRRRGMKARIVGP